MSEDAASGILAFFVTHGVPHTTLEPHTALRLSPTLRCACAGIRG